MSYTLEELLDERNRSLYEEVSTSSQLSFETVSRGTAWGVRYDPHSKVAELIYSNCANPVAAFTHELLHVKFEINGYQKPEQAFKPAMLSNDRYRDCVNVFRSSAYNHLMHFKMYPEFVALGFPPDQFFLEPSPSQQSSELLRNCKKDLEECGTARERNMVATEEFIRTYFVMSAPSTAIDEQARWLKSLQKLDPSAFSELDRYKSGWRDSIHPDIRWHLARLFYMCGHHDVGIGYVGSEPVWASDCRDALPSISSRR